MPDERDEFLQAFEDEPEFQRHITRILRRVGGRRNELQDLLAQIDVGNLTQSEQRAIMRQVNDILDGLDDELAGEVQTAVDDIYEHGRARTLVALGAFSSVGTARRYLRSDDASLSRAHRNLIAREVETTMDDLLAMTNNTRRRVKSEVRKVAAETFRSTENVDQQRRDMKRRLKSAGVFAIRDAANRRWTIDRYSEVAMKTKMTETHREATEQEAREQGADYVVISRHGNPCRKCQPWEGRVLKINAEAEGAMPTLNDAINAGLFHPACLHHETPTRNLDALPSWAQT